MRIYIEKPKSSILKRSIESFIFSDFSEESHFSYTSFPNTNLFLSIHPDNKLERIKTDNQNYLRIIEKSNSYSSRLYGLHKMPFKVDVVGKAFNIGILFKAGGLFNFTSERISELLEEDSAFESIFPNSRSFINKLFDLKSREQQTKLLEDFLIRRYRERDLSGILDWSLQQIQNSDSNLSVGKLAARLNSDCSTVFRNFKRYIGQSPKDYTRTVRFRRCVSLLTEKPYKTMTELTYLADYFDQPHFIRDFKTFSGMTPLKFRKRYRIEHNELVLITE